MKRMEPWKIAVIVVSVVLVLALIIGLTTYFLRRGKCTSLCCRKSSGICCVSVPAVVLHDDLGTQFTPGIESA